MTLRLPEALPLATLQVEVLWPDGSPAIEGARAFAEGKGARAAFEHAAHRSNRVTLTLALHRRYDISVDWLYDKPRTFQLVEGDAPQSVNFTHDGQSVTLRLKNPRPR